MSRPGIFNWAMPIAGDQFKGGYFGTTVYLDNTSDTLTIEPTKGSVFRLAADEKDYTFFFGEVTSHGGKVAACVTLIIAGLPTSVTWKGVNLRWSGNEEPELSDGVDIFTFITDDDGGTWYGALVVSNAEF